MELHNGNIRLNPDDISMILEFAKTCDNHPAARLLLEGILPTQITTSTYETMPQALPVIEIRQTQETISAIVAAMVHSQKLRKAQKLSGNSKRYIELN